MHDFETPLPCVGFPLVGRARFRVTGADHLRYLNGQLTQDLKKVTSALALPACITSAKGRLQAEVWVLAESGSSGQAALLVDAPGELREALLGRLERYIVADDVTLEDVTGASELLHFPLAQLPDIPELAPFVAAKAARLGGAGWDVWVPADKFGPLCEALGGRLGSAKDFERLRVQRGIPAWGAELTEDTMPPEAGLDKTHVDYHKGCYIGQEVISRLKSVGHVNRALHKFTGGQTETLPPMPMGASGLPCSAGESLYEQGNRDKVVGMLTSVTDDGHGGMRALGYVKRGVEAEGFETEKGVQLLIVPNTTKQSV
jgi:tRNA-modifying protein YgfZ